MYFTKNSWEYPPPPFNPLPGTYQVSKRNTLSYIAFANILIENQILRQSCIEPYTGTHQRIFLACGGMLRCRLQATDLWLKAEVTGGKAARKKAFRVGHYNDFTEQETAHKKSLGTQGNWTTVLEKIYWRSVFLMEPRQNRELKLWKRQILSNSWLRCQKQRSLSWTQKCTKGLGSTRNQS